MVRTRKRNKAQRTDYAAVFTLDSDDSGSEFNQTKDGDGDVEFDEEEGSQGSEDDEADAAAENEKEPSDNEDLQEKEQEKEVEQETHSTDTSAKQTPADSDDSDHSSESLSDKAPTRKGKKLPKRAHVHEVPTYPSETRATRIYDGPLKESPRGSDLFKLLYGPDRDHIKVFHGMLAKWFDLQILPSGRVGQEGVMSSPWLSEDFEDKSRHWSRIWHERSRAAKLQHLQKIRADHIDLFKPQMHKLICFVGHPGHQTQARTSYGFGQAVAENGQVLDTDDATSQTAPKGWLLDSGGIPLAIGWAPSTVHKEQFIAVCSVPFSDQEPKDGSSPDENPEEKQRGSVQIWSIPCHRTDVSAAALIQSLSFDWGRPQRLQWCPVPSADDTCVGVLAVLTADGFVRVMEVPKVTVGLENYEWVDSPVATLGITDEDAVKTTCFTWVNINRICLGHSDGSTSLWSIYPQQMLSRRSAHTTYIVDIASGFPSHPYHIATIPVGGYSTLTDLNLPSAETTFIPTTDVNFQPNLLDWNDHLQGFFAMLPSSSPQKTVVGWAHVKFFVQSQMLLTAESPPMCIASGKTHPFTLVGCADGSLWAFNPMRVLMKERYDDTHKLKVLQHEFRPPHKVPSIAADKTVRGAARISQGFRPVFNSNARLDIHERFEDYQKRQKMKRPVNLRKPGKKSRKRKGYDSEDENEGENGMKLSDEAALARTVDQSKVVVHDSRTRITVAAWNPNVEFGWWAAAAMGSGLIKVMDLGLADVTRERRR
ncbi:unnamed protein product [Discula destructiva]